MHPFNSQGCGTEPGALHPDEGGYLVEPNDQEGIALIVADAQARHLTRADLPDGTIVHPSRALTPLLADSFARDLDDELAPARAAAWDTHHAHSAEPFLLAHHQIGGWAPYVQNPTEENVPYTHPHADLTTLWPLMALNNDMEIGLEFIDGILLWTAIGAPTDVTNRNQISVDLQLG